MAKAYEVFKSELWSKKLLRDIQKYGVMLDCVNRDYEGEIKNQGDTVHIQKVNNVTINTYSEGDPIDYERLDGTSKTLLVDQQKAFGFQVDDIEKVQANVTLMDKYIANAKKGILLVKDTYLHGVGIAGASNDLGTVAVTSENIYKTLVTMFEKLADKNAIDNSGRGADGKRPFLVLPPQIISLIKLSAEAKNATTLGDETMRKGAIMEFAGFDIKQSTNVAFSGGYKILAGTTEGITYADQIIKIESLKDKDNFGDYVRGLYVYGGVVAQPDCLAKAQFTLAG